MRVPEKVSVKTRRFNGEPVQGVIVTLSVKSGTKNRYLIHFPKTDPGGNASISRLEFREQYEDHWDQGLMDYNGAIEEAEALVIVSLFNTRRLREYRQLAEAWPLLKGEQGKWASRSQKIQYFLSSTNEEYVLPPFEHDLEVRSDIDVRLA